MKKILYVLLILSFPFIAFGVNEVIDFTSTATCPQYGIVVTTDASKPTTGLVVGQSCYAVDTKKFYVADSTTTWLEKGATTGGSGLSQPEVMSRISIGQ